MRGILLIPVKDLSTAKQRLADALSQAQRSQLAEAMLRDVMTAASGVLGRIDVALVTGHAPSQELAQEFGFGVIEDARNEGETAAIEMATAWCEQQGYDATIVVPGDIPLITSDELHRGARRSACGRSGVCTCLRSPRQQLHPAAAGVAHPSALRQ